MAENNAELIYESINSYQDIQNFLGQQEDIYLDFKESKTTSGTALEDDKSNFSKAASGFAHQEGGVVIWGIEARKNKDKIDCAANLKPISSINRFFSDINSHIKVSTVPVVDCIKVKKIFENDDQSSDSGFLVVFFPKSSSEHCYGGIFYKRYGDSFVKLTSPADIKSLLFRSQSPLLEFVNQIEVVYKPLTLQIPLTIINKGNNLAKNVQVLVGFDSAYPTVYDESAGNAWRVSSHIMMDNGEYKWGFLLNSGVVVHVGTQMRMASLVFHRLPFANKMKYKILAENMYPVEDVINLEELI